ncbi:MAG: response regulator transcription factor [Armatimonadota bacterium]|nr:response regulator transcription factor [Armatimonadota bacterium]MDR5675453.1 response regulator transcription factor [Armatimonadota bacterium]MDR5688242.1 response regulator transcription factor [Armatimonadota bacterium]MDR7385924.1 response regulator transcription factor [Armatimonadota bacterium]MDR7388348.1 response regulator transcription factor [Armatimonadota bacterium]
MTARPPRESVGRWSGPANTARLSGAGVLGTVLVVEDEPQIAGLVQSYLERAGFRVEVAFDGASALHRFADLRPDVVVLDLMLPGTDGWEVCRRIRERSRCPVVMLTARDAVEDRVQGLELGADDYVTKPFSPRELVARIQAVLRRRRWGGREVLRVGDLVVDFRRRRVIRSGRTVQLTATEWKLLEALASQPGHVLTRWQIIDRVYGESFEGFERTVDVHVKNLRQKLEPNPQQPRYVLTVHGVGYKFARPSHGPSS